LDCIPDGDFANFISSMANKVTAFIPLLGIGNIYTGVPPKPIQGEHLVPVAEYQPPPPQEVHETPVLQKRKKHRPKGAASAPAPEAAAAMDAPDDTTQQQSKKRKVSPGKTQCHCGFECLTDQLLQEHKNSHTVGNWKCSQCEKVYTSSKAAWIHFKKLHLGLYYFSCHFCQSYQCQEEDQLKKHISDHHSEESGNFQTDITCPKCHKSFASARRRDDHQELCKVDRPKWKCNFCNKTYLSQASRDFHESVKHKLTTSKFYCRICKNRYYERHQTLLWHMRTKHPAPIALEEDA
jgi:hypothetical protein